MRKTYLTLTLVVTLAAALGLAQQAGPYKILKTAKTGGAGGFDYIYADVADRQLYIPRGADNSTTPPSPARVTVFNLDTLAPIGEVPDVRASGAAVDAESGHGFATSKPVTMWDTKTLKVIKTINVDGAPDGLLADAFNHRIYILSHQAPHVTVIDAKSGDVLGTIDLGGAPEQAATDGAGHIYIDVSDKANVAVVDAKTMTVTAHYDLGDKGNGVAGLAIDAKNHILFAACRNSGIPPANPATPTMVILNANDGKIITTLPLAGASDGAQFNPATMEAFSTHGNGTMTVVKENSPTSFVVEQNLDTMNGAKTLALDTKTNHILTMAAEYAAPPAAPPAPAPSAAPGAPPAGRGGGRGRAMLPDSFTILMIGK
jgi:DNA-binding beta-propeller fold protein YncE